MTPAQNRFYAELRGGVVGLILLALLLAGVILSGCSMTTYTKKTADGDEVTVTHNEVLKERRGLAVTVPGGSLSVESSKGQGLPIKEIGEIIAR